MSAVRDFAGFLKVFQGVFLYFFNASPFSRTNHVLQRVVVSTSVSLNLSDLNQDDLVHYG